MCRSFEKKQFFYIFTCFFKHVESFACMHECELYICIYVKEHAETLPVKVGHVIFQLKKKCKTAREYILILHDQLDLV